MSAHITYQPVEALDTSLTNSATDMVSAIATDGVDALSLTITVTAGALIAHSLESTFLDGTGAFGSPFPSAYMDAGETIVHPVTVPGNTANGVAMEWMGVWSSDAGGDVKIYFYVTDFSFQNGGSDTVRYRFDMLYRVIA